MYKWEYRQIYVHASNVCCDYETEVELKELGLEGFELVDVTTTIETIVSEGQCNTSTGYIIYTLKRPIE